MEDEHHWKLTCPVGGHTGEVWLRERTDHIGEPGYRQTDVTKITSGFKAVDVASGDIDFKWSSTLVDISEGDLSLGFAVNRLSLAASSDLATHQ